MATTQKTLVFDVGSSEDLDAAFWACIFGTLVIKHEYDDSLELPSKFEFWQVKNFVFCTDSAVDESQLILWLEKFL